MYAYACVWGGMHAYVACTCVCAHVGMHMCVHMYVCGYARVCAQMCMHSPGTMGLQGWQRRYV